MQPVEVSNFNLPAVINGEITTFSLEDVKSDYVYLIFYPYDFTFVCPTEIITFSKRMKEFQDLKTEVVFISCDSVYSHLKWASIPDSESGIGSVKWPLISDFKKELTTELGLLNCDGACKRASVLIDKNRKIKHLSWNSPEVGRSVPESLRVLKGFIDFEKNGEMCYAKDFE